MEQMPEVLSVLLWGIGLRVFSVLNHLVVSVRPGKDRNRCSFLVPLDAPAHKVPNDTPAAKLADTIVKYENFRSSNSSLGVSVLIRWGAKGNTKPAKVFLSFTGRTDRAECPTLKRRVS